MKDLEIKKLIKKEAKRQNDSINLIASENFTSRDVMEATGSILTNKYSEGYPEKRYYPGSEFYDEIENLAIARGLKLFKLSNKKWGLNVQPHSGSPANLAIYSALLEPGDTLMGMALTSGGHLTHGHKVSMTGRFWNAIQYKVDDKTGLIDYDEVLRLAIKHKPKIIVSGFSAYPRKINFKRFAEIAKKVGAYHFVDMSHTAGLTAGGAYQSPFPYADVVMTTTHKTLRGPRGAVIFSRIELSEKINKAVFPGLQGGPHNNVTAGIAVAFNEAMQKDFKDYAKQVILNAKELGKELKALGFTLITGGTDNHILSVDVRSFNVDGFEAEKRLEKVGIIANRNTIPGDKSPFKPSGIRLGTPSITSRGMKEVNMKELARLIHGAITNAPKVKADVKKLYQKFPTTKFI